MGLESYKLDKSFSEGVDIRLDNAPDDVFRVKLPSQYNRGYTAALYGAMTISLEDGDVKAGGNLVATRHAQEDAFVEYCLESLNGEPLPDGFVSDYPSAIQELITKSSELAAAIEERVGDTVKKLSASSPGSESGQVEKSSTLGLKSKTG
jgi:hypothetical protein